MQSIYFDGMVASHTMQQHSHSVDKHVAALRQNGVIAIEGYKDEDWCDKIKQNVDELMADDSIDVANPEMDYNEKTSWDGALLDKRDGTRDDGMRDIFNADKAIENLQAVKHDEFISNVVNGAVDEPYTAENLNVYINRSVTGTRGYHADTYGGKFKSFIYLTDVPDESYGPFAYIKGSHDKSTVERYGAAIVNKLRGKRVTDAAWYDDSKEVKFTAPKGTLIIANQAGFHRGTPQQEGKERMLVTTSYTAKEETR